MFSTLICENKFIHILQGKVNLPSSVFASDLETEVGLLNKAAPVSGQYMSTFL